MILVLLQNGWSTYYTRIGRPGEVHDRESYREAVRNKVWAREMWIDATWSSRSGQNLKKILGAVDEARIWLDDTTLEIADKPSGIKPIDAEHVAGLLARQPELILACGKQAEKAVGAWTGPLIIMPHPAYRVMNNLTLLAAREIIATGEPRRCRIWPTKEGHYTITPLDTTKEDAA